MQHFLHGNFSTLVSLAFVLIHEYLQPETPEGASLMTDKQRVSKISQYHEENNAYNFR